MGVGATAQDAVSIVRKTAADVQYRQLLAVDATGQAAVFSGSEALGNRGEATGPGVASGGNLLVAKGRLLIATGKELIGLNIAPGAIKPRSSIAPRARPAAAAL